jgi:hypothetical protein
MSERHKVVKVIFVCPEVNTHTMGVIGRQVVSVGGRPAGAESYAGEGATIVTSPDGQRTKLVLECQVCTKRGSRRRAEMRWDRAQILLDHAEQEEDGVLVVPLTI